MPGNSSGSPTSIPSARFWLSTITAPNRHDGSYLDDDRWIQMHLAVRDHGERLANLSDHHPARRAEYAHVRLWSSVVEMRRHPLTAPMPRIEKLMTTLGTVAIFAASIPVRERK
jgi:hypothetical protein